MAKPNKLVFLFLLLSLLLVSSVVKAKRAAHEEHFSMGSTGSGSFYHDDGGDTSNHVHDDSSDAENAESKEKSKKEDTHWTYMPKTDFVTANEGCWEVHNPNVGVSAMQLQLMPNNKAVWFDTTSLGPSARTLDPPGNCPVSFEMGVKDCFAHAIAYDIETAEVRTLKIDADPWCSSGGLDANGNLVGTGGNLGGFRTVRTLDLCANCQFKEYHNVLNANRWYATQQILEDGSLVVIGGRASFSYELLPPTLATKPKLFNLPFLQQTTDPPIPNTNGPAVENNLYPFAYLIPDGNIFLFANNRAILLNPWTGTTVREYPTLQGGSRNYPPSGMSALLPLKLESRNPMYTEPEVMVCGGNSPDAFGVVDLKHTHDKVYMPALKDCWRIKVFDQYPQWVKEQDMPSPRTMGDLLHLPTGDLLFINGAKKGTSGWDDAVDANLTPVLYSPNKPKGFRFKELKPTDVPRMYHSSSALLPDGKILVVGSNPHQFYTYDGPYPTDLRVQKFAPPYLDPMLDTERPIIVGESLQKKLEYGEKFTIEFDIDAFDKMGVTWDDIKVTMIAPPFTTHGFCQNQRMLILANEKVAFNEVTVWAPMAGKIAPPGYYMLFVVHRGVPSRGVWVHISS